MREAGPELVTLHLWRVPRPAVPAAFRERYGEFELWLNGPAGYRVPNLEPVVAHLTLRVPGPYATTLTIKGRVVPGEWPTTYSGGVTNDLLSCG